MCLTDWPSVFNLENRRSHCVDLPARSRPSKTINFPRFEDMAMIVREGNDEGLRIASFQADRSGSVKVSIKDAK